MKTVRGQTYTGKRVKLDGTVFHECTFNGCTFLMEGGVFHLADCDIGPDCEWAFVGAAANVIDMLQNLYQIPMYQPMIEETLERIKSKTIPESLRPEAFDA